MTMIQVTFFQGEEALEPLGMVDYEGTDEAVARLWRDHDYGQETDEAYIMLYGTDRKPGSAQCYCNKVEKVVSSGVEYTLEYDFMHGTLALWRESVI